MRRWTTTAASVLVAGLLLGAVPASAHQPSPSATVMKKKAKVSIVSFAFKPASITVKEGTTVIWRNKAAMSSHTTTSDTGLWDSGALAPGKKFKFKFKTAGVFTYHCSIHPQMTGTITVTTG